MEFFAAVEARRSCRRYTSEPVPAEVMNRAIDAALLAPNSSNMQLWQFYWVRSPEKKKALGEACFSQPAATTAQELVVCVGRRDLWRRNSELIIEELNKNPKMPKQAFLYYKRLMPMTYTYGVFNIWGYLKFGILNLAGLFRPSPRKPNFKSDIFEVIHKSNALACENFMLAIAAQGYASCPMEGFDECRVKRLLNLNRHSQVTMVLGVGRADPVGIWGNRFRIPRTQTVFEV